MPGRAPATLAQGAILCGYAVGDVTADPRQETGKTVGFQLRNLNQHVIFEGERMTLRRALERPDQQTGALVLALANHAVCQSNGVVTKVEPDLSTPPRYFVPSDQQPPFDIMNIGQLANDMAVSFSDKDDPTQYQARSKTSNVLSLEPRLERDPQEPMVLQFSRPITVIARDVTFANTAPMELGCEYGFRYWGDG